MMGEHRVKRIAFYLSLGVALALSLALVGFYLYAVWTDQSALAWHLSVTWTAMLILWGFVGWQYVGGWHVR